MTDILIIEDNIKLNAVLKQGFEEEGYQVKQAHSLADAQACLQTATPRLILLDAGMPDGDGFDLLRTFRQHDRHTVVMMLTARDPEQDRVAGFRAGADDYMIKPFSFPELLARIRRHIERLDLCSPKICWNGWVLDQEEQCLRNGKTSVEFRPVEMRIMSLLLSAAGKVVSRQTIYERVWPMTFAKTSLHNTLEVHISRMREKIQDAFSVPGIMTIRGEGYRFMDSAE